MGLRSKIQRTIRKLFSTIIISVNVDSRACYVQFTAIKRGIITENQTHEFKTVQNDIPIEAAKFIRKVRKKYPFTYIASMSHSIHQGAVGTVKEEEFIRFGIFTREIERIGIRDSWSAYISKDGIKDTRKKFAKSQGLDLLFSPFLVLYYGVLNRLDDKKRLYILQQRSNLTLAILDKHRLHFGSFFILESELDEERSSGIDDVNIGDISENIANALEVLDHELGRIGALEELDENVVIEDFEEHNASLPQNDEKSALDDFARIINIEKFIRNSLNEFYKNEIYNGDFIDEIIILDTYGISSGALSHLKNTLLIDTKTIPLEVTSLLTTLARMELAKEISLESSKELH